MTGPGLADESIVFLSWIMGKALRGLLLQDRDEFLSPKASKRCTKIEIIQNVLLASTADSGTIAAESDSSKRMYLFLPKYKTAFMAHCWGKSHNKTPWKRSTSTQPRCSALSDNNLSSQLACCEQGPRSPSEGVVV